MTPPQGQNNARRGGAREVTPDQAFAIASQQMQAGRLNEADQLCQRILAANPRFFRAQHLRGLIALNAGQPVRAASLLRNAIALKPDEAVPYSDLGWILHGLGQQQDALAALEKAVELAPGFAGAHLNYANVLSAVGRMAAAEVHWREAIRLDPSLVPAHLNLVRVMPTPETTKAAVTAARNAVVRAPRNALAHSQLGIALGHMGNIEKAVEAHRRAVELAPRNVQVRLNLVESLASAGELDEAAAQCRELLALAPRAVSAYAWLVRLGTGLEPAEVETMLALGADPEIKGAERVSLHYAIGKALESRGDFRQAFGNVAEANRLVRAGTRYSKAQAEDEFAAIKAAFTPATIARFADAGSPDTTPIFVLGMPRSGTSLVEQILTTHEQVDGAGETSLLPRAVSKLLARTGTREIGEALEAADPGLLRELGEDYAGLLRSAGHGAPFVVDKMPGNFLHVGLIRLILPRARIVYCRREALDNCFSIFKTDFTAGQAYKFDLGELGHYYRLHDDLMAHWARLLPGGFHTLDYEAMVADQEGETRKLLGYLGLDWSPACLEFFKTRRTVHTASIAQVRKPIYNGSVGLAQRYGDALDPLRQALGEPG